MTEPKPIRAEPFVWRDPRMFAQVEKARLVSKLKAARDRKRASGVKVEGRRSYAEARPEAVAKKLHRYPVNGRRRSLRGVAGELAKTGFVTSQGRPYAAAAVAKMLKQKT